MTVLIDAPWRDRRRSLVSRKAEAGEGGVERRLCRLLVAGVLFASCLVACGEDDQRRPRAGVAQSERDGLPNLFGGSFVFGEHDRWRVDVMGTWQRNTR